MPEPTERMTLDSLSTAAKDARRSTLKPKTEAPTDAAEAPPDGLLQENRGDLDTIRSAVSKASSFMNVGSELKKLGLKHHFSTDPPMPPMYLVTIRGKRYGILNKKYATDPDFVVGDIAVGAMS